MFCQFKCPHVLRRGSAVARLLGFWVQISPGYYISVSYKYCVFSDRGLCDGLIVRPVESYRLWCVFSVIEKLHRRGLGPLGLSSHESKSVLVLSTKDSPQISD